MNRRMGRPASFEALGQLTGRVLPVGTAGITGIAHKNAAAQISTRTKDHGFCTVKSVEVGADPCDTGALCGFFFSKVREVISACFSCRLGVSSSAFSCTYDSVCGPSERAGMHRGPLPMFSIRLCRNVASAARPITPPKASTSRTRCPLAVPPMDGLQGQIAHAVQRQRKQRRLHAQPRGGTGRLDAGVPCADDHNVKISQMIQKCSLPICSKSKWSAPGDKTAGSPVRFLPDRPKHTAAFHALL